MAQWLACAAHNREVGGSKPPSEIPFSHHARAGKKEVELIYYSSATLIYQQTRPGCLCLLSSRSAASLFDLRLLDLPSVWIAPVAVLTFLLGETRNVFERYEAATVEPANQRNQWYRCQQAAPGVDSEITLEVRICCRDDEVVTIREETGQRKGHSMQTTDVRRAKAPCSVDRCDCKQHRSVCCPPPRRQSTSMHAIYSA